jgi:cell shape-determining protein MreD
MGPAFAAVGAGIVALLELTVASRYQIDGAQLLQFSLVFAIAVTVVYGFEEGMAWAFVGGLFLDLLALRPLGASIFELLVAVALTTVADPLLARSRYLGCIVAVLVITPLFLVISDATTGLLRPPAPPLQVTSLVVAAIVNAIAAAVLSLIVIAIKRRSEQRRRVLWWR